MGNHEYALIQVLHFVAQEITDEDFIPKKGRKMVWLIYLDKIY
jgi:hypothetical protein